MSNWFVPHDDDLVGGAPRRNWVLLEFVALAIVATVILEALGGIIGAALYSSTTVTYGVSIFWLAIEFGTRWVNPPFAGLLLAELAVCWMSFGQWAGPDQDASLATRLVHLRRLVFLINASIISFVLLLLAALGAFASLIGVNRSNSGVTGAQLWASNIYSGFDTLAVIVLTFVGLVAALRLRRATRRYVDSHPVETPSA
ncbi:MAG: hypothetical protein HKL87_08545 [Acidimicrobiaceae bacterium]|nr:hypothetical protein [Acidimicrobiaceae bacterium]